MRALSLSLIICNTHIGGVDLFKLGAAACICALVFSACTTSQGPSPEAALAEKQFNAQMDVCDARTFKKVVDKIRCKNDAMKYMLPVSGGDADLIRYIMAKQLEIAKRLDAGKITREQANSEIEYVYVQMSSEEQRRRAERLKFVSQVMVAQNQSNALSSMANSQARIAGTLEDAEIRRSSVNGQPDPFVLSRISARQIQ